MLEKIRSEMKKEGIDWLVVYSEDPHLSEYTGKCDRIRSYITGFTGSAGILVLSADKALLWTDSRYFIQAGQQLSGTGIELMKYGLAGVQDYESYLAGHVLCGQTLAFDHMTLSYDEYKKIARNLDERVSIKDAAPFIRKVLPDLPEREFNEIYKMSDEAAGVLRREKIKKLRSAIEKSIRGISDYTYIISDLTSIMWLLNLRGADIKFVPVAYAYVLMMAEQMTLYVCKDMLSEELNEDLTADGISIKDYDCFYDDLDKINTRSVIADSFTNNARILSGFAVRGVYTDVSDTKLIPKCYKNDAEINGMKNAHIKDAVTMIRFIKRIKEMAARVELTDEYVTGAMLDDMRTSSGACELSFKTICAYADNSAVVHYTADEKSAKKIEPEGFLLVDSGGQYRDEGTTDITRTISLGPVSDEEKKIYTAVLKGNLDLMASVFPQGYKGSLLDAIAEKPLWDIGCFCGHGIGHGVGHFLSVHESEARISRREGIREADFLPGIIVSDEPGIYLQGKFGVRLENLLLVIKSDEIEGNKMCTFTPLTLVPFDKESIDVKSLSKKELDTLHDYYLLIWDTVSPHLTEDEQIWLKEIIDIK